MLNIDSTPSEKAISVAMGMATPRSISASLGHVSQNIITGTSIPPIAPIMGSMAFFIDDSSPTSISLFISRPTERKNMAMRKSFITAIIDMACPLWLNRLKSPIDRCTSCSQNEKYCSLSGEFAINSASIAKNMSTPLALTYLFIMLLRL